jgi:DNA invertase Pin-like site-specific DNA recombinase
LFNAACTRQIDVVLVWRDTRFARSTQALVNALKAFQPLGVDCISSQEHIDTTTPQGALMFTVWVVRGGIPRSEEQPLRALGRQTR